MQVSINGTSKEVVAFLVSLSGRYAEVVAKPAPVVMEVVGGGEDGAHTHPDHIAARVRMTVDQVVEHHERSQGERTASAAAGDPPTENLSAQQLEDKLTPRTGEEVQKIDPPKIEEPKTRKRREKVSGESKLGTGAPSAVGAPASGAVEPTSTVQQLAEQAEAAARAGCELPSEWPVMSVQARRNWITTAQHLAPSQRLELLHANPAPVAEPEPVEPAAEKPAPVVETKAEPTPAADTAVECVLPPTWEAWSLAKRIMWATMRSVSETNSLLKQFGFADKIDAATADTLFNVRRKLEIAMRMEAQA